MLIVPNEKGANFREACNQQSYKMLGVLILNSCDSKLQFAI
jgi:hypothetical protein